jgi:hypothetical protein
MTDPNDTADNCLDLAIIVLLLLWVGFVAFLLS